MEKLVNEANDDNGDHDDTADKGEAEEAETHITSNDNTVAKQARKTRSSSCLLNCRIRTGLPPCVCR